MLETNLPSSIFRVRKKLEPSICNQNRHFWQSRLTKPSGTAFSLCEAKYRYVWLSRWCGDSFTIYRSVSVNELFLPLEIVSGSTHLSYEIGVTVFRMNAPAPALSISILLADVAPVSATVRHIVYIKLKLYQVRATNVRYATHERQ